MIAVNDRARHQEVWLLLPWLASGRLSAAEREMAEQHVQRCTECERELANQHLMHQAFNEPDRVTYAPGPSFRKLMTRIDGDSRSSRAVPRTRPAAGRSYWRRLGHVSLWRPPGLAWAASFILLFGLTGLMGVTYHWLTTESFRTVTDVKIATPNVLHIALDRSLTVGEEEELLRSGGARIVEGPDKTGVLGVTPINTVAGQTSPGVARERLHALSARLRADPRVLWVEPLRDEGTPADQRAPDAREH